MVPYIIDDTYLSLTSIRERAVAANNNAHKWTSLEAFISASCFQNLALNIHLKELQQTPQNK